MTINFPISKEINQLINEVAFRMKTEYEKALLPPQTMVARLLEYANGYPNITIEGLTRTETIFFKKSDETNQNIDSLQQYFDKSHQKINAHAISFDAEHVHFFVAAMADLGETDAKEAYRRTLEITLRMLEIAEGKATVKITAHPLNLPWDFPMRGWSYYLARDSRPLGITEAFENNIENFMRRFNKRFFREAMYGAIGVADALFTVADKLCPDAGDHEVSLPIIGGDKTTKLILRHMMQASNLITFRNTPATREKKAPKWILGLDKQGIELGEKMMSKLGVDDLTTAIYQAVDTAAHAVRASFDPLEILIGENEKQAKARIKYRFNIQMHPEIQMPPMPNIELTSIRPILVPLLPGDDRLSV